jgi:glycosyltransferase involved in cell wall biosynthesis
LNDASTRPLRIAYLTNSRTVGGAEKLFTALLAEGKRRGVEQVVLNPFVDEGGAVQLAEEWKDGRYRPFAGGFLKARRWLAGEIASFRPDIVHSTLFQASVLLGTVRRRGEKRLLTHAYGEGLAQLSRPKLRRALDGWSIRRFDHVSAISESVKTFLERTYRLPPPPLGKIVLGWQGTALPPLVRADRPPTVVCVAVLRKEKGHDTLLAAFAKVKKEVREARLVLVGGGPWRAGVEALVAGSGVADSVDLLGRVPDIWPYLADADVFALASPMEALGIAVMEAMAAGLPSVVSDTGGLPEFVQEGVTGELFPPGDHDALAEKLVALLRDRPRREAMGAAALEAARALHMDASVAKYFALYQRLLGRAGTGGGPMGDHQA